MDHHRVERVLDLVGHPGRQAAQRGQLRRVAHQRLHRLHRLQVLQQHRHAHHPVGVLHVEGGDQEFLLPAILGQHHGGVADARGTAHHLVDERQQRMRGVEHLVDRQAHRLLQGEPHHPLGHPVHEQHAPLRVEEDHPVLELVDHLLQMRLLAEGGEPVRLQLAAQARELCRQLLELVAARHHRRGLHRLAAPDAVDLPHDGPDRAHRELGHHHRGQPGERQRHRGHREALLQRGGHLPAQERGGDPEADRAEQAVVEGDRQRGLVGAARGVEGREAAQGVELQQALEARAVGRVLALLAPLGVHDHRALRVRDQGVEEVRRVADAAVEEAPELGILPEGLQEIRPGGALQGATALGVDLLGDQLRLLDRLLHHHAAHLGDVDRGRGGDHQQGQEADDEGLAPANPEPHARCRTP